MQVKLEEGILKIKWPHYFPKVELISEVVE